LRGNSEAIRFGSDGRALHGDDLGRDPLRVFAGTLDRISDVAGRAPDLLQYEAGTGASPRTLTNVRQAMAVRRSARRLASTARDDRPSFGGVALCGLLGDRGTDLSDHLRTDAIGTRGAMTGAIAAAVPQGSLAATTQEIVRGLVVMDDPVTRSRPVRDGGGALVAFAPLWPRRRVSCRRWRSRTSDGTAAVRSEDEVGRVASRRGELRNDLAEGARMAAERGNRRPKGNGSALSRCALSTI
jgi:hypothetical protein